MILLVTARPSPKPTLRVVKNGSEALPAASALKPAPLSCTSICAQRPPLESVSDRVRTCTWQAEILAWRALRMISAKACCRP